MTRLLASALLLGACLQPAMAQEVLSLPAETELQVRVLTDKTVQAGEMASHILLKPVSVEGRIGLPEYCLMSAEAAINGERLEMNVTRVLCVNEARDYYEGAIKAHALGSDNEVGLDDSCTSNVNGACQQAMLQATRQYRVWVEEAAEIPMVVNQSELINIERRQAEPPLQ